MTGPYCYAYPHPAVTTDIVVFTIRDEQLQVLLIRRGGEPFRGQWALPGGFLDPAEDLDQCATRELAEETGLSGLYLEQLYTFGRPDRDPRERVVSVAYFALVPSQRLVVRAASDAAEAAWHPFRALPPLAFDHSEILALAHRRLTAKLGYSGIAFEFLPNTFTLSDLQRIYEILLGEVVDKRNFRKWALGLPQIEDTGERRCAGNHRPARLYRLKANHRGHTIAYPGATS
ncbi:ADP-ribose pyrophosphatase [Thioflavicoccus mobilis 8321]|uniref:ADP-ribose pyrophosphatase n=1 Tax=Thioflavicoccus mobilis 8321 TaxID=765912 RepID=L0H047_9GAMM|nr:NUDIX domain-containing protein [Thioflavicoccus mobilis]AGA90980.1 ADP-ribose pyrophosphatase [Thioflavicoccus mobilis 8321]